jgi:hypothetical protein
LTVFKNAMNEGVEMDLRTVMPITASLIDRMRAQLGRDVVNAMLRKAMAGEAGQFFAMENHKTFGTPDTTATSVVCWDEADMPYRADPQWMTDATEFALTLGIEIEAVDDQDHEEARERATTLRNILSKAKYEN